LRRGPIVSTLTRSPYQDLFMPYNQSNMATLLDEVVVTLRTLPHLPQSKDHIFRDCVFSKFCNYVVLPLLKTGHPSFVMIQFIWKNFPSAHDKVIPKRSSIALKTLLNLLYHLFSNTVSCRQVYLGTDSGQYYAQKIHYLHLHNNTSTTTFHI
jgi:hypothetical protein